MTYIERITYQVGNFIQLMQFTIKNAYRLVYLTQGSKNDNPYMQGDSTLFETCEANAMSKVNDNQSLSSKELIEYFTKNEGLSKKDLTSLSKMLSKRDYIVSYYFVDNATPLAMEDAKIYEEKIKELDKDIKSAQELNLSIARSIEKLYKSF